jgi:amino acid efflux transporter
MAGHTGELQRVLTTRDLVVYYVSSLVGAGLLAAPGIAFERAGPASLVAWGLLTLAAFPIAGVFARFSAQYPNAAGVSFIVRKAFGWRPGMVIGLLLVVINWTANPILGLVAARYFAALMGWTDHTVILIVGFAVMTLGVVLNMLGIRTASRVQLALVVSLVVGLITVMVVSASSADADRLTPFAPNGWTAIGAAILAGFFSFFGWENVSHAADEVRDPHHSYPRAAVWAPLIIGGLYCALALTVVLVIPTSADVDRVAVLDALLRVSHGSTAARLGSALAVILLVVTTNAWVMGASRLTYALARDGIIPEPISRVSPRNAAPIAALLFLEAWYLVDFLVLFVLGGDEEDLIPFTAATILIIYIVTFLAGLSLFQEPFTRLLSALALVAVTGFLVSGGVPSLLAGVGLLLTVAYVVLRGPAEPAAESAAEPQPETAR